MDVVCLHLLCLGLALFIVSDVSPRVQGSEARPCHLESVSSLGIVFTQHTTLQIRENYNKGENGFDTNLKFHM